MTNKHGRWNPKPRLPNNPGESIKQGESDLEWAIRCAFHYGLYTLNGSGLDLPKLVKRIAENVEALDAR